MAKAKKLVKVLAIDGGGIRGIIPATLLAAIEHGTHKPICELFDLVAGTSTGGILALGLVAPGLEIHGQCKPRYSAQDAIRLYVEQGAVIFNKSILDEALAAFGPKYHADGIEKVLAQYFGQARLSQALTDIIITSYEIERRTPYFFKSRKAKDPVNYPGHDFLMADIARATSAAPTYFGPQKIETPGEAGYYALVDGGVFANNPAMCAYAEAMKHVPDASDILLVSVGTGKLSHPLHYAEVQKWGLLNWARPILDVVFDGVSDTVDYQLKQILPAKRGRKRFYRFQITLDSESEDMDDASEENIRTLRYLGEELVQEHEEEIAELCRLLTA